MFVSLALAAACLQSPPGDDELVRATEKALKASGLPTIEERARALAPDAVAVDFRCVSPWQPGNGESIEAEVFQAQVIRPSGELVLLELGRTGGSKELVRAWRAALGAPVERGVGASQAGEERAAGEELRRLLVDPVLAAIGPDARTLRVRPAADLHLVPLDALPFEDGRVGDRYRVVLDVGRAEPAEAIAGEPTLLALGDPAFAHDGSLAPLPHTGLEARAIAQCFEQAELGTVTLLTGAAATKAAFARLAPSARYLHVATHSFERLSELVPGGSVAFVPLDDRRLAFAGAASPASGDGVMTGTDLAALDLSSCELVVLSASETNVGLRSAGFGNESLQAAVHAAGARTAITSLWMVDDAATNELFERFYTYLWVEKLPKADALWRAKTDLRAAGHPLRHWAGWVLSGDPD